MVTGGADALYRAALVHWEHAFRNPALTPAERHHHLIRALHSGREALAIDPHHTSTLTLLSVVLRTLSERDAESREALLREAEDAASRARASRFRS